MSPDDLSPTEGPSRSSELGWLADATREARGVQHHLRRKLLGSLDLHALIDFLMCEFALGFGEARALLGGHTTRLLELFDRYHTPGCPRIKFQTLLDESWATIGVERAGLVEERANLAEDIREGHQIIPGYHLGIEERERSVDIFEKALAIFAEERKTISNQEGASEADKIPRPQHLDEQWLAAKEASELAGGMGFPVSLAVISKAAARNDFKSRRPVAPSRTRLEVELNSFVKWLKLRKSKRKSNPKD